jgi:hypothetical protein
LESKGTGIFKQEIIDQSVLISMTASDFAFITFCACSFHQVSGGEATVIANDTPFFSQKGRTSSEILQMIYSQISSNKRQQTDDLQKAKAY